MKQFCILLISCCLLIGCKEEYTNRTISGKVFLDCKEDSPIANRELIVKRVSTNKVQVVGASTTDDNGNYSIETEIEDSYSSTLSLVLLEQNNPITLAAGLNPTLSYNINSHQNNYSTFLISNTRTINAGDTLFYAFQDKIDMQYVVTPPIGIIDTITISNTKDFSTTEQTIFYYGIGTTDFQKALQLISNTDSSYQQKVLNLNGCYQSDTLQLL